MPGVIISLVLPGGVFSRDFVRFVRASDATQSRKRGARDRRNDAMTKRPTHPHPPTSSLYTTHPDHAPCHIHAIQGPDAANQTLPSTQMPHDASSSPHRPSEVLYHVSRPVALLIPILLEPSIRNLPQGTQRGDGTTGRRSQEQGVTPARRSRLPNRTSRRLRSGAVTRRFEWAGKRSSDCEGLFSIQPVRGYRAESEKSDASSRASAGSGECDDLSAIAMGRIGRARITAFVGTFSSPLVAA